MGRWTIIVLSWNGRDDTLACLDSLTRLEGDEIDVICVDNGSSDGSVAAVRERHRDVALVENGRNLGFAGGNNAGIERALDAGAEWVVLLNNDATLAPDAIERLREAAARRPDAGVLAGKVFFADPPDRIWFAGQRVGLATGYSGRPRGHGRRDAAEFRVERTTDRAVGAFMAVSRAAIEAAGLLDDELFAYVEDVDWSLRIRRAGFSVWFVPDAVSHHRVSASSGGEGGSATAMYYGVRNTIAVCERHLPLRPRLAALRRLAIGAAFALHAARSSQRRRLLAAVREGWRDARAGRFGERRSV